MRGVARRWIRPWATRCGRAHTSGKGWPRSSRSASPTTTERLSCESSGLPWATVSKHGVEDREELAHGGGEGDFPGAAGRHEALVKGPDRRVVLDRRQGGHVQHAPDVGPAAPDHPAPAEGSAVTGDWRQAGQGRDAAAVEPPQFRQIGDEGTGGDGADAGDGAEQIVRFAPDRGRPDQGREVLIEAAQGLLEPGDVGIEVPLQAAIAQEPAPVVLGAEHVDELAAAGDAFAQRGGLLIGDGAGRRPHRLRKESMIRASSVSVLASCPVARAKSRIWRGLTTATGSAALARVAATGTS